MNSWPKGYRHAMSQDEHAKWNSYNYPGTKQLCVKCDCETERCEEDSIFIEDDGPFCEDCYHELKGPDE